MLAKSSRPLEKQSSELVVIGISIGGKLQIRRKLLTDISKQQMDLIPLRRAPEWEFLKTANIRLPGAHGDDLIRSIYIHKSVSLDPSRDSCLLIGDCSLVPCIPVVRMATFERGSHLTWIRIWELMPIPRPPES